MIKGVSSEGERSQSPKEDGLRAFLVQSVVYGHAVCNPFPAKAVTPLVKIASKHSLSGKICWPAVFVSKPLFHFGVHDKWELKPEVISRPTYMQEPLCEGHHLMS